MFNRDDYLKPKLLQYIGVVALVGQIVFWAVTAIVSGHGQSTTLFIGPSMLLIFVGQYQETVRALRKPDSTTTSQTPPPAPAEPTAEQET